MKNYSRRELYAHGEPLGESVTRRKLGGGYVCGGGGGGGSSSSSTTTQNTDKRVAVDSGVGLSGDNSSITINSTDGGIVSRALDSIDSSNALHAQGFTQLLDASKSNYSQLVDGQTTGFSQLLTAADRLFMKGEELIGTTQKSVADAYNQAQTTQKGTIDNKTIIVLGVAGAAAAAFIASRSR